MGDDDSDSEKDADKYRAARKMDHAAGEMEEAAELTGNDAQEKYIKELAEKAGDTAEVLTDQAESESGEKD